MGSSAALLLARQRGVRVTLFDRAAAPFEGASRWNEGKIHLGYLYGGDPSLATARRLLPGGLRFRALTEQLIGCSLDGRITERGDVYLVHRRSVVDASSAGRYFAAVNELTRRHDAAHRYLVDVSTAAVEELSADELATSYNTAEIVAGFRVPEHSVQTGWVADRFVDALTASSIDLRLATKIVAVRRTSPADPIFVETQDGSDGPYDAVINTLWDGRLRVDASIDLPPPASYSHRFRLALFLRTHSPVALPSTVVATGPFGDVKNYTGRDLYVSWYPAGLIAEGQGVDPPSVGQITVDVRDRVSDETIRGLSAIIPELIDVQADAASVTVAGGWVSAAGHGSLADPLSSLHRREKVGITRSGGYFTIDTGKYSIAPWLAEEVVKMVIA